MEQRPDFTDSQKEQIKSLFYQSRIQPPTFEWTVREDGYLIEISQMYNYVKFKEPYSALSGWLKVAEILGCQNGDEEDRVSYGGCETCEYGSSYEVTWRFW